MSMPCLTEENSSRKETEEKEMRKRKNLIQTLLIHKLSLLAIILIQKRKDTIYCCGVKVTSKYIKVVLKFQIYNFDHFHFYK